LCSHSIGSQYFVEYEGSLPTSQELTTCPYPEPDQSSPHYPHLISKRSVLILSTHLSLGLPNGLFPCAFPTKNLYVFHFSPTRTTCPVHLILLDLIILIILGEEYKSRSSSLCNFHHSPVTSSLFGPNILLTPCSQTPSVYVLP
jgi:hypothetical protein